MERRCPKCHAPICRLGNSDKPFVCRICNARYSEEEVVVSRTNFDRIVAQTPEELAAWLNQVETDGRCGILRGKKGWLDWLLKQET